MFQENYVRNDNLETKPYFICVSEWGTL